MEGKIVKYTFVNHKDANDKDVILSRSALVLEHDSRTDRATLAVFSHDDGLVFDPHMNDARPIRLVRIDNAERGSRPGQWHEYEKKGFLG